MDDPRFPDTDPDRAARLIRCRDEADRLGIGTLVLTSGEDLRYLLGASLDSHERLTALVVDVAGDRPPVLVLPALEVTSTAEAAAQVVDAEFAPWSDGDDAATLVTGRCSGSVAVSASTPARHVVRLQSVLGSRVRLASEAVDPVRSVKSPWEIERLADAARRIDEVHARMGEFLVAGRSEREAATRMAEAIVEVGLDQAEFVIVGSGPHGADPHHEVSDRTLTEGDVVVVDIGGPEGAGYHSDCTRTYALGDPGDEVVERYAILAEAQRLAREHVRPGIRVGDVDAVARGHLDAAGMGELFVHRTGHGIGLGLHEPPFVAPGEDSVLCEGMTFTVEPGLYRRGAWGARLEDVVAVTTDGCRALNSVDRELRVL